MTLPLAVGACGESTPVAAADQRARVVAIDYCADQAAVALVPAGQLVAVSREADSDPLFTVPRARGLPRVRPVLEDILALRPTRVVRSYGGGPDLSRALMRLGIDVVDLPYAADLAAVRAAIPTVAAQLGNPAEGARQAARFDAARAAAQRAAATRNRAALYLTPGDVTAGPDTLVGEAMAAAGLHTMRRTPGWGPVPLEQIAVRRPDAIVTAFLETPLHRQDAWSSTRHPVAASLASRPRIDIPGSMVACGNWRVGDALALLARGPKS